MSNTSGACINPPNPNSIYMFPGTKGDKGDQGDASVVPGPRGLQGDAGPVANYTGAFNTATAYYDNSIRRDIVSYSGKFWIANNHGKNGATGWTNPLVGDWVFYGSTLVLTATALDLLQAATIKVGLNFLPPGYAKSDNFVDATSGWLLSSGGGLAAYDAIIHGLLSTNTPKFNLERPTRTMPSVAEVLFDIGAIADGDIPEAPTTSYITDDDLIFFGWKQGTNTFITNRFGNTAQKFDVLVNGLGTNTSGGSEVFFVSLAYRTRNLGGAWGAWNPIGNDCYIQPIAGATQSFDLTRPVNFSMSPLTGNDDIQFGAGFSKGAGGVASLSGATITAKAYN